MLTPGLGVLAADRELAQPELAYRLEHAEPRAGRFLAARLVERPKEAPVHQRGDAVQDVDAAIPRVRYLLGRLQGKAAAEHRQPP